MCLVLKLSSCQWIKFKFENFSLELDLGRRKLLISILYKLPSASWEEFECGFDELTRVASRTVVDFISMADFNFDLLSLNGANLDYFNLMVAHDLLSLVNIPTRVTSLSAALVDNTFAGFRHLERSYADVVLYSCSDHLPVVAKVPCGRVKK